MGSKPGYRGRRNARLKAWGAKVAASDKAKRIHSVDQSTVTLTLARRDTDERITLVSAGRSGTHECILAALIPYDPSEWAVVCLSTPATIRRDLKGPRRRMERPEWQLLGQLKLKEYLP